MMKEEPIILIVDDSRSSRMMCTVSLKRYRPKAVILEAASGLDALAVLDERVPDYILLDMNMPGMSGLDLAEAVRKRFSAMPIGLLTSNVQKSTQAAADAIGIHFFRKPIDDDLIREAVDRLEETL